ncbi:hypothetical protein F5Y19DRAFT_466230 [Xylariaceae sp. FL1651]|nr:hypothetical protein F5Y19DRAFT_466230 [Xylariaceae sp. FL1651]
MCAYNNVALSSPSSESARVSEPDYSRGRTGSPTSQQLQALAIHIDMEDSAYMSPKTTHLHGSLSERSPLPEGRHSSATPPTSTYGTHDMAQSYSSAPPFSSYAVSPYTSSLSTPVSVAGSPLMSERPNKMISTYNQHGEYTQQLTPPSTSAPWTYTSNMTSASSSSMAMPSTTAEMLDVHSLESSHSPELDSTVADPTPHFSWNGKSWGGPYSVSHPEMTEEIPPLPPHPLYPNIAPSDLMRSSYGPHSAHVQLAPGLQHSSMPSQHLDAPTLMANDPQNPYRNFSNVALEIGAIYSSRRPSKARAKTSRAKRGRNSNQNPTKHSSFGYSGGRAGSVTRSTSPNTHGPTTRASSRHLTLADNAPEDAKYLVELRCQMSEDKGKGMWEAISEKYKARYPSKSKENLQMTLIRAIQLYALEILKEAVEEYERRRYPEIRRIMKEKGGCRIWDWRDGSIARALVSLGIDELDPETKKTKRKMKRTVTSATSGEPWKSSTIVPWLDQPRELTAEEEEALLDEFRPSSAELRSLESDHMEDVIEYSPHSMRRASRDSGRAESANVAKQACKQMLDGQDEHPYVSAPSPSGHSQYMS